MVEEFETKIQRIYSSIEFKECNYKKKREEEKEKENIQWELKWIISTDNLLIYCLYYHFFAHVMDVLSMSFFIYFFLSHTLDGLFSSIVFLSLTNVFFCLLYPASVSNALYEFLTKFLPFRFSFASRKLDKGYAPTQLASSSYSWLSGWPIQEFTTESLTIYA